MEQTTWIEELLWVRECKGEAIGSIIIGLFTSVVLAMGSFHPVLTHFVGCILSVGIFALLVGAKLASTPED